jgi:hypothetical protein
MDSAWPRLAVDEWADTRDTLHMWSQIVGKVGLALAPMINHWWQTTYHVNASGMTTRLIPWRGSGFEMVFDFHRHVLAITTVDGEVRELALTSRSVSDFYREFRETLDGLGIEVQMLARPVEVELAIPFAEDTVHATYDPQAAAAFWRSLVNAERVMTEFRSRFIGKVSPVHFFWGGFDLAVTRFSGRRAPLHHGGAPNCADWVMELAYSHEVSSCGYWPFGSDEGIFYSYSYPEPAGYRDARVGPDAAFYDESMGEFVLPYSAVRQADDPDAYLLSFLQSTYESAANCGRWDRDALENASPLPG